jgi:DNA-binding MarR family transcriptional regulator
VTSYPQADMSSTSLTNNDAADPSMADSRALDLVLALARAEDALLAHVARELDRRGYPGTSPSSLAFLAQLDCGVNVASEVARRLGHSRQMVAKTAKQLGELGYLETFPDPERGNRKVIAFTATGQRLAIEARAILADLDQRLTAALGPDRLDALLESLEGIDPALEAPEPGGTGDAAS